MAASKTVNGALLRVILRYCGNIGLDTEALCGEAGIGPAGLADPERRVPVRAMRGLWRAALRASGDLGLALRIAGQSNPAMFGLVGHLALISRDVGEALDHLLRYQRLLAEDAFWSVERTRNRLVVAYDMERPPDDDVWRQGVELSLANVLGALRFLTGRPVRPRLAQFSYPDPGCRELYDSVFGCPLRFGAARNALEFAPEVTALPFASSLPMLAGATQQRADTGLRQLDEGRTTTAAVNRALTTLVPAGRAALGAVARELALSERTLTRRLAGEGSSFRRLLDQHRLEAARAYLEHGEMGVEEVAFRLGYSDLTGFHRAFRRNAGCRPGEYRRGRRGERSTGT